ncbi:protein of unknown function DUF1329 [Geotalea daltonii FRC-32]|uniref:DUF1329 domain-containing protein n=1 Tax=Geotalea daltonii (strain DSM 22248 / JCM 15807 / FRC-32) TaxID=316067 RepID=B9M017_GEODF|nr:DUF1329 domain-containing protein [Geotalea daltonii]ACM20797.1 protein of unknown function DUF1329 [Geotalea daltonii FRC-32]
MLKLKYSFAALLVLTFSGVALAAVSQEEAAQLGKNLTMIGAEKAGNKEGTIPEYTGGNTKSPAGYKNDGWRPDPYAGEKPLFSITAKNMAQYANKLSEGAKAMLKKYPSFRIDVYKTYRSAAHPKYVQENTKRHALTAKLTDNGLAFTGAHAGYPFPIPKSGIEAIWNHILHYEDVTYQERYRSYTVDAGGRPTMQTDGNVKQEFFYYDPKTPNAKDFYALKVNYVGPSRRVGESFLIIDPLDYARNARQGWQYLPGQRRVKLAPDLSFDTPCSIYGGQTTWDDLFLFSGSPERYNWKLVGKKEMYIPYNDYKMLYQSNHEKDVLKAKHLNPDLVRWELHRVWVVEATLKPGKRHLYSKRVFYLDEDSWRAAAADQYDGRGQLYRVGFTYITPSYDSPCAFGDSFLVHDLLTDSYAINALPVTGKQGIIHGKTAFPRREWTSDSLAGQGIR